MTTPSPSTALWPPAPLEDAWRTCLESTLARSLSTESLGRMVSRQAARYRGESAAIAQEDSHAVRLLFWFPRDLGKVARPVAELVRAGALPARGLRVLDLGAGLGATSLGVLRALAGTHLVASIDAVDVDGPALSMMQKVYARAVERGLLPGGVKLTTHTLDASKAKLPPGPYDLVVFGLAAVEITAHLRDEGERGRAMAKLFHEALRHTTDDGALVVIEPAAKEAARALHHARQTLLADGVTVFSPCLHARACPMLETARDWCHEDHEDAALPDWLVPVAKAAGLRWEGPTWSYLVLRRDGKTLRHAVDREGMVALRAVSKPVVTKGKTEVMLCGDRSPRTGIDAFELDRAAKGGAGPRLRDLQRGDLLAVQTASIPLETGRPLRLSPDLWRPGFPKE